MASEKPAPETSDEKPRRKPRATPATIICSEHPDGIRMKITRDDEAYEFDTAKLPRALLHLVLSIGVEHLIRKHMRVHGIPRVLEALASGILPAIEHGRPGRPSNLAVAVARVAGCTIDDAMDRLSQLSPEEKRDVRLSPEIAGELARVQRGNLGGTVRPLGELIAPPARE
jgi:hypothetical protein